MRRLTMLACAFGAVVALLPFVFVATEHYGVFVWSPEISYSDILVPVSILVSFLVFAKTWEQSKKDSERKGVFEFLNKSYIHKECVVDIALFRQSGCVVRGENRILLRDLRHIYFRYTSNTEWVSASADLWPYTIANQVAFNLADNLELLGEALVAGFLPFREVMSYVGNNIVEDWLGACHWVEALRAENHEKNKRVNGELIACMAFLSYCARGRFERLRLLQKRYPLSFALAYGSGKLAKVESHVQVRLLEILGEIDFIEPDLERKARALVRKGYQGGSF